MDEKTEELRDIFMEVTDEETVTESQVSDRGSLTGGRGGEGVKAVLQKMREEFDFRTNLDDEDLSRIVRSFYEGADDEEIATDVGCSETEVFEARMDLLLVRDEDAGDVDLGTFRERLDTTDDLEATAAALELETDRARKATRVLGARERARTTSYRYQTAFEERLTDADLSVRLTDAVREDGLAEAAEDIETNVDF